MADAIENGAVTERAFSDLFEGSSTIRRALNPRPVLAPPRDALVLGRVADLPRGLAHGGEVWETFAVADTDGGQDQAHAEVRARREADAPDLVARKPPGKSKDAKEFRKHVRMEVARRFELFETPA